MNEDVQTIPEYIRLSPEFRLLVAASWIAPLAYSGNQASTITSICSGYNIDWEQFIVLVDRHRMPVLVYISLHKYADGLVPAETLKLLKERSTISRIQAMQYATELARLLKIFAAHGISVIPLKGALLSQQLFNDPCIRHSKDLDIMVRPEHIDLADQLLKESGYDNIFPGFNPTEKQKTYLYSIVYHFEYKNNTSGLSVELHWRGSLWTALQTQQLWAHSRDETWLGIPVFNPNDIYKLLYLCDHGAGHKWFRLKWLSDIAQLLEQFPDTDFSELLCTAEQLDLKKVLAQSLLLIHWLYGIALPEVFLSLIQDEGRVRYLAESSLKEMLFSEQEILDAGKRLGSARLAFYLMRLKTNMPKWMILKRIAIIPMDIKTIPLPSCLFFLYILLRPILWFKRYYLR
jgi:hypothetical protein